MKLKRLICYSLCLAITQTLSGCNLLTILWNSEQISDYGESVFRQQNSISNKIMMLEETELPAEQTYLLQQAEIQIRHDCRLLNDYASAEMEHRPTNLWFRKRVKDSLRDCERSIEKAQALLKQFELD
jgi:hypothetical protein